MHVDVVGGLQVLRGRQRVPVDLLFDRGDRLLVEGGDPAGERVDERVEFPVGDRAVDPSVPLGQLARVVVAGQCHLQRAGTAEQQGQMLKAAAAGQVSVGCLRLAEQRAFTGEAHVHRLDQFAAHAPDPTSDLRNGDDGQT